MKTIRPFLTVGLALAVFRTAALAEIFPIFEDTAGSPVTNTIPKTAGAAKTLAISAKSTAFISFSVGSSGIDPATVTAARLTIYFATLTKPGTLSLRTVASSSTGFQETFTARTIPAPALDAPFATLPLTTALAREFVIFDVTTQVKAWLTTPANDRGLALTGDATLACLLASKEGAASGHPAIIEVDVNTGGGGGAISGTTATFSGGVTAATFAGSGASLTGLSATNLTGALPALNSAALTNLNATNITSGTLADARLSANVPLLNTNSAFTGDISVGTTFIAPFRGGTTGANNSFLGMEAGRFTTTGEGNTILGRANFATNTTGSFNVALGFGALQFNSTGARNTSIGTFTLTNSSTGDGNTALGSDALRNLRSGNNNIAIGNGAGVQLSTGANNIAIGHAGVAAESGTIRLGTPGTHTQTLLAGNVGMGGAADPGAVLTVTGAGTPTNTIPNHFSYGNAGPVNANAGPYIGAGDISIKATHSIIASDYKAVSDARIKNIQGLSDNATDLGTLRSIEITDYLHKDVVSRGSRPQKKVIAQQVERVFPQAVSRMTDVVPDIYAKALIKDGWVELATDLKVGDRVKLIGEKETGIHPVLEVRDGAFRTAFQPSSEKVFVFGREVKDFRAVDYEAIAMLNVSATQELARKLEAKDAELTTLKAAHLALAEKMAAFDRQLAALKADRDARPARTVRASLDLK